MIDKTAIIHPTAKIADDAIIGPYVVIGENVTIGHRTRVISNAHIEFAEIGDDCTISPFATIGSEPQDLGYKGEETKVVIGDGTIIKENVTIHRAAACGDFTTRIGNKCLLMVGSHVAHNCVLADQVILANLVTLGGHVHVGFGAFVGGMSVFHQNIRIGDMAIISGFSASRQDILPYSKAEKIGIMMPVAELTSKYYKSAYYEDEITIITEVEKFSPVRIKFTYKLYNSSGDLINIGSTMHAWTDTNLKIINLKKLYPDIYDKLNQIKQ